MVSTSQSRVMAPDFGMMNRLTVFPAPGHGSAVPQVTEPATCSPKIRNEVSQPSVRGILPSGGTQIGHHQGLKVLSLLRRLGHAAGLAGEVPPDPVRSRPCQAAWSPETAAQEALHVSMVHAASYTHAGTSLRRSSSRW